MAKAYDRSVSRGCNTFKLHREREKQKEINLILFELHKSKSKVMVWFEFEFDFDFIFRSPERVGTRHSYLKYYSQTNTIGEDDRGVLNKVYTKYISPHSVSPCPRQKNPI